MIDLLVVDAGEEIAGEHRLLVVGLVLEAFVGCDNLWQVVFYWGFALLEALGYKWFGVRIGHYGYPGGGGV